MRCLSLSRYSLDEFGKARRSSVVRGFIDALTRGGEFSITSLWGFFFFCVCRKVFLSFLTTLAISKRVCLIPTPVIHNFILIFDQEIVTVVRTGPSWFFFSHCTSTCNKFCFFSTQCLNFYKLFQGEWRPLWITGCPERVTYQIQFTWNWGGGAAWQSG